MSKKEKKPNAAPSLLRLCAAVICAVGMLVMAAAVLPWHFPYDRLEHLYGIRGYETIEAGHPGGDFVLNCRPINGSPEIELLVDGELYCAAECLSKDSYGVTLGAELFETPRVLELTLRETFRLPVSLRSNTVRLHVVEPETP